MTKLHVFSDLHGEHEDVSHALQIAGAIALVLLVGGIVSTAAAGADRVAQIQDAARQAQIIAAHTQDRNPVASDRIAVADGVMLAAYTACNDRHGRQLQWQRIRQERGLLEAEHAVVHQVMAEPYWESWVRAGSKPAPLDRCADAAYAASVQAWRRD